MVLVLALFTLGALATFDYALAQPKVPFFGLVLLAVLAILLGAATVVAYLDARGKTRLF